MWGKEEKAKWQRDHKHPCLDCGAPVSVYAKWCHKCAGKERWVGKYIIPQNYCPDCGKPIHRQSQRCRACASKHTVETGCLTGKNNSRWKGGRTKQSGYCYITTPDHPRRNCMNRVPEHHLVWEKANGKYLPENWIVHHINGIRDDNRIENLMAMPANSHSSLAVLHETQKRVRTLENELRKIKSQRKFKL